MIEDGKKRGFMDVIGDGLHYLSQTISASIFPPIAEGTEMVMKNIETRIIRIEKRILRNLLSFLIILLGSVLLTFALFSFLVEYLKWSNTVAFFSIGTIVLIIGLILKLNENNR